MKIFTKKNIVQKVIIAIVIVLSFNFIIPNYSQADWGGVLFSPIIDFGAGLIDAGLTALQYFMYDGAVSLGGTVGGAVSGAISMVPIIGDTLLTPVKEFNAVEHEMEVPAGKEANVIIKESDLEQGWFGLDSYQIPTIKYTPEKIFSNQIPALDVNFINPKDANDYVKDEEYYKGLGYSDTQASELAEKSRQRAQNINAKSITMQLHSTIANWYIALRNLAIVALLSVLLYVGIRIVISSTASDKAKYKQMLLDWIVALCIVFFLHYIMSFILTVTDMITQGISSASSAVVEVVDDSGNVVKYNGNEIRFTTDLTGLCRMQIQNKELIVKMIYLIFYGGITIYTFMFTWTYVKRAIMMAFLTLMAPVVAITYPIDKISDGKAQAYGTWLKEFIFNALLQPFHLIIYTVFLGSAYEIAVQNPIYAILFLATIFPAEKLLRKMFGFEKSGTAGSLGTAASILGGAAVLKTAGNLIGKAGGKGKSGGNSSVRTKNNTVTDSNAPSKVKDMASTFDGNQNKSTSAGQNQGQGTTTQHSLSNEESQEMEALKNELNNADYNDMYLNPSAYQEKQNRLAELENKQKQVQQQRQSQQTQARNRSIRDNFAWRKDENGHFNDNRSVGQWLGDGIKQTVGNNKFVRKIGDKTAGIREKAKQAKALYNSRNPFMNTIRGAVGTTKKATIATAKFAGKAAVGGTLGLMAGIAGNDLDDVLKFGAAGMALGVTGLPVLGRGISNAATSMRNAYETEAFGAEEAALKAQTREQMKNEEYRSGMDELYEELYGVEPTAAQSRDFAKDGIESYYNSGITSTKEIKKSMKFEKELRDRMVAEGASEDDARERAKKQAMVISKIAQDTKPEQLMNDGKRNDIRNSMKRELMAAGMDKANAEKYADYSIELLKKRKGVY